MPGLLSDIFSFGNTAKRRLRGLLDDPMGTLDQLGAQANEDMLATHKQGMADLLHPTPEGAQRAVDRGMALAGMAPLGMIAYHGSPHKFDKFSLDKIGTGEGAQAYGHGLYLAESPEVAKQYSLDVRPKDASQFFAPRTNVKQNAIDYFKSMQKGDVPRDVINGKPVSDSYIAAQISGLTDELPQLYKTDIPDEAVARFLDWDKPLSQQAPEVQKAIADFAPMLKEAGILDPNGEVSGLLGKGIYEGLGYAMRGKSLDAGRTSGTTLQGMQDNVTRGLKAAGIPGIRYLDGGSRSAGQGSSNFVVFDPEMIRILERNGVATGAQPWKPGEYQLRGLLGN